jgi:hypothetical protein
MTLARRTVLSLALFGAATALIPAAASAGPVENLFANAAKSSTAAVDHGAWTKLLQTYVVAGGDGLNRVDYARFKRDGQPALKAYLVALQTVDPATLNRVEQFAYLANLYNAKTIAIVLEKYPIASIKDISLGGGIVAAVTGGPWKAKVLRVKGVDLSLDDIEHAILRPVFKDPRVHYSVNCASIGCPNLNREAFTGANLEAQLDASARAFINSPRAFKFDNGRVTSSSIYSWFKADFGGTDDGVLTHARKYATAAVAAKLAKTAIDDHAYDWRLNDIER